MASTVDVAVGKFPQKGEVLLYLAFEDAKKKLELFDKKTNMRLVGRLKKEEFKGKDDETVMLEAGDLFERLVVVGAGKTKDFTQAKLKNLICSSLRKIASMNYSTVSIFFEKEWGNDYVEVGQSVGMAFFLSNYHFDQFKGKDEKKKFKRLEKMIFYLDHSVNEKLNEVRKGVAMGQIISQGIYLTRDLVNLPASHVYPEVLASHAKEIGKNSKGKVSVEVLNEEQCRKLGMGAFLGVAAGSNKAPKFIILHYKPQGKPKQRVCLIGKTITFDSGGLSLKPAEHMMDMKLDMAGGATVLGVFKILSDVGTIHELSLPEVYGILPACENMPSGKATKPGDIVTALNGKTIEILNTDAEGRVVLADALSYAEKYIKPNFMIDIATLTGACMVALGHDLAGMFGNDEKFLSKFEKIAKQEGDELWKLPLYQPYIKLMKSDIADLKNIGGGNQGGAITAALFLSEFVNKSKWIHLDIAGPSYNSGEEHGLIPKGGTGWGVATLIEWLNMI